MRSLSLFTDKIYPFGFIPAEMSFRINFKAARNQRVGYILLFMDILAKINALSMKIVKP